VLLEPYIFTYVFKTLYLPIIIKVLLAIVIPLAVLSAIPIVVLMERRRAGIIQNRMDSNSSNIMNLTFSGLLHPLNGAIETPAPKRAKVLFYYLAPALAIIPAIMTFAVIPFAAPLEIEGIKINFQIAAIDPGMLYILAVSALGIYGVMIAGWAGGDKFSLSGGMRAALRMLSCQMVLGVSLVSLFMIYSEIEPSKIVELQGELLFGFIPEWGIFLSPVAFFIFAAAAYNRTPFGICKGGSETAAEYPLEYGGVKFAMFMTAECLSLITMAAIITTMFFGGYQIPYFCAEKLNVLAGPFLTPILQIISFSFKTGFLIWLYIRGRRTLPRSGHAHVMKLYYLKLFPIAMANIFITALVVLMK